MPKQKKLTQRLKAIDLTKPYIKANFNQAEVARQRGVSRATINEQVHKNPTRDSLQKYLDSAKLKQNLVKVAQEGLMANRSISAVVYPEKDTEATGKTMDFIDVPDHNARHKFWRDLMLVNGALKHKDGEKGDKTGLYVYIVHTEGRNNNRIQVPAALEPAND